MLNKLRQMLQSYDMLPQNGRVYCAVSGGADSMALLWGMYLLKDKLNISLEAVHFNHHLRGLESDGEERFVRQFCDDYAIPLTVGSAWVTSGEKGLEAAAREARYAFFETLPGIVATAHTADDNAETVLMRMVRGTGLKGLGGICPIRGKVIRPMLLVTRQEVMAFLEEYHLPHVEDSSNASDAFFRNRLRHTVMPLLRQENPKLAENLSAMALRLREDEASLTQQGDRKLSVSSLERMTVAQRRRKIAAFLECSGVKEPEAVHIGLVEKLMVSDKPSAKACFPGGVTICRQYDILTLEKTQTGLTSRTLVCPGETLLPEIGMKIVCRQAEDGQSKGFVVMPVGKLTVRSRQPGDEIRLPGGRKSLKKLFIDRKIPAAQRDRIPVVCDERGILTVYGIGGNLERENHSGVEINFEPLESGV